MVRISIRVAHLRPQPSQWQQTESHPVFCRRRRIRWNCRTKICRLSLARPRTRTRRSSSARSSWNGECPPQSLGLLFRVHFAFGLVFLLARRSFPNPPRNHLGDGADCRLARARYLNAALSLGVRLGAWPATVHRQCCQICAAPSRLHRAKVQNLRKREGGLEVELGWGLGSILTWLLTTHLQLGTLHSCGSSVTAVPASRPGLRRLGKLLSRSPSLLRRAAGQASSGQLLSTC